MFIECDYIMRCPFEKFSTYPSLVSSIVQSFYVDDLVCEPSDKENTYKLFESTKKILGSGSLNLQN